MYITKIKTNISFVTFRYTKFSKFLQWENITINYIIFNINTTIKHLHINGIDVI